VLREPDEVVESVVRGPPVPLHEQALGLLDQWAALQGPAQTCYLVA
jgi:hypothetical protein